LACPAEPHDAHRPYLSLPISLLSIRLRTGRECEENPLVTRHTNAHAPALDHASTARRRWSDWATLALAERGRRARTNRRQARHWARFPPSTP
jgi:hypothetical protein